MFGGDWPVCMFAAEYAQVRAETNRALGGRSSDEIAAPHYGTATRA
jgi:predicted TIM-barrel fold metal-dependent hydrolase